MSDETSPEHKQDVRVARAIRRVVEAAQAMYPHARSTELNDAIRDLDLCTVPVCKHERVANKCMACVAEAAASQPSKGSPNKPDVAAACAPRQHGSLCGCGQCSGYDCRRARDWTSCNES